MSYPKEAYVDSLEKIKADLSHIPDDLPEEAKGHINPILKLVTAQICELNGDRDSGTGADPFALRNHIKGFKDKLVNLKDIQMFNEYEAMVDCLINEGVKGTLTSG